MVKCEKHISWEGLGTGTISLVPRPFPAFSVYNIEKLGRPGDKAIHGMVCTLTVNRELAL